MRKRILAALLAATMIVSLCACGNGSGDTQQPGGNNAPATPPTITSLASFDDFKTILKDKKYEVTDEDVVDYFVSMLCAQGAGLIEVKDRDTVQKGDVVQVDYTGYLNDKAFDGGAAKNQIIVKHNVTFPKNYSSSTLAGKETTFEFNVDRIYVKATPDNVTDDYVKKYMEKQGFTTVEALLTDCREQLVATAVINYTIANSKVDIPDAYLQERLAIYENAIVEISGATSIEEFVRSQYQATVSSIRPYWLSYIKTSIITEVVLAEMIKSKDVKADETKLQEYIEEVMSVNSNFTDADDIYFELGYGNIEKGKERLSNQLAITDYILEKYRASQSVTE